MRVHNNCKIGVIVMFADPLAWKFIAHLNSMPKFHDSTLQLPTYIPSAVNLPLRSLILVRLGGLFHGSYIFFKKVPPTMTSHEANLQLAQPQSTSVFPSRSSSTSLQHTKQLPNTP